MFLNPPPWSPSLSSKYSLFSTPFHSWLPESSISASLTSLFHLYLASNLTANYINCSFKILPECDLCSPYKPKLPGANCYHPLPDWNNCSSCFLYPVSLQQPLLRTLQWLPISEKRLRSWKRFSKPDMTCPILFPSLLWPHFYPISLYVLYFS